MGDLIYNPVMHYPMKTAVFLSGIGTNFKELYKEQKRLEGIVERLYGEIGVVFSDVPECEGVKFAEENGIPTKKLSSKKIFEELLGMKNVPIDSKERRAFDLLSLHMVKRVVRPDLICLAGYERWLSPYFVRAYRNKILNVHPGDSSKGYIGMAEVPTANAILAGEESTRSTIFFVDESKDGGPILVQSHPIPIFTAENSMDFVMDLESIQKYAQQNKIHSVEEFREIAKKEPEAKSNLGLLLSRSKEHQNKMKEKGDWPSYKFAVHHLIAKGRVAIDSRSVYVDGNELPSYGFRLDEHPDEFKRSGIII